MNRKPRFPRLLKRTAKEIISKPATSKYPFVKPPLPHDFRGEPMLDPELCIGCGLCNKECPSKAIEMVEVDGKRKPEVHLDKCIFCYRCVDICPKKAMKQSDKYELATTDKSSLTIKPKTAKRNQSS